MNVLPLVNNRTILGKKICMNDREILILHRFPIVKSVG